ncbi:hypothetical protein GALL_475950 [mine drainage metagenome]|uniref:DUF2946 domain-containing protein n=1 Tax=mine drainage metagenome TaxID=410659 RepID=A0A1J5PH64_9ZZZZ
MRAASQHVLNTIPKETLNMDAAVAQAMASWPHVARCSGWLALDDRGRWWMRNHSGPALWPRDAQGRLDKTDAGPVLHDGMAAFIGRNYTHDAQGAWFFQNGPQRVDVSLESAPWIVRLHITPTGEWQWWSHTLQPCAVDSAWLDVLGRIWLHTDLGPGLLHSNDMPIIAAHLDATGTLLARSELPPLPLSTLPAPPAQFFGFLPDPASVA